MSKQPIKSVQCITAQGVGECYEVGRNNIDLIKRHSDEYPDHTEHYFYVFDNNGYQVAELLNCPVEVKYAPVVVKEAVK